MNSGMAARRCLRALLLAALVSVSVSVSAAAAADRNDQRRPAVDEVHDQVSRQIIALGRRLDTLFGIDDYGWDSEGSLLRVGGTVLLVEEDDPSFDALVRLRLALPRTEERLSLVFEAQVEDMFEHPREGRQRIPGTGYGDGGGDDVYVAGLQYLHAFAEYWNFDADLGVRVRWPLDPYTRLRLSRSWWLGAVDLRLGQRVFWYEQIGRGTGTELRLQREVLGGRLLRSVSDVTWLDRQQEFQYSQDFLLSRSLREARGVIYQLGVRGRSEPNHQVSAYFVNLRARRTVGWNWLFVELRPELLFEREHDFAVERRLFLTAELVFGDLRRLD